MLKTLILQLGEIPHNVNPFDHFCLRITLAGEFVVMASRKYFENVIRIANGASFSRLWFRTERDVKFDDSFRRPPSAVLLVWSDKR